MRDSDSMRHVVLSGVLFVAGAIPAIGSEAGTTTPISTIQSQAGALLEARCTTCHDLAGTGIEPGLYSADDWRETVNRMIGYGLSLTEAEFETIVTYLGSTPETVQGSGPVGGPAAEPSAEALLTAMPDELGGRQLALTRLVVPPGSETMGHRHQAVLAVYVLSGRIESAVDDAEPTLYGPGDVWYESHMQLHSTFRNPSATEPVTLLIFAVRDADHPAVPAGDQ